MNKGLLLIISGPSGAGKGSIVEQLIANEPNLHMSVSFTTRKPRDGEKDGINYCFISKKEFESLLEKEEILEYTEYCGNYYGTPKANVEHWLNKGYHVILEIEVDGCLQIKSRMQDAIGIFVLPPSLKILRERLYKRGTESEEIISQRISIADIEIKQAKNYDYVLVNNKLEDTIENVKMIIHTESHRYSRSKNIINEVLSND